MLTAKTCHTEKKNFKRNELRPSCFGISFLLSLLYHSAFTFDISYINIDFENPG